MCQWSLMIAQFLGWKNFHWKLKSWEFLKILGTTHGLQDNPLPKFSENDHNFYFFLWTFLSFWLMKNSSNRKIWDKSWFSFSEIRHYLQKFQWIVDKLCIHALLSRICTIYYIFVFVFQVRSCFRSHSILVGSTIVGWNKIWRIKSNERGSKVLTCSDGGMSAPTTLGSCYGAFVTVVWNTSHEVIKGGSKVRAHVNCLTFTGWFWSKFYLRFPMGQQNGLRSQMEYNLKKNKVWNGMRSKMYWRGCEVTIDGG